MEKPFMVKCRRVVSLAPDGDNSPLGKWVPLARFHTSREAREFVKVHMGAVGVPMAFRLVFVGGA